eukprot:GEMP01035891.1.p1 GENE.GEMP01035891.1~~GEMP01035891.1.p1  ORF type:complete len:156 (+),score=16.24 GEMP01035891.1:33-470(+)
MASMLEGLGCWCCLGRGKSAVDFQKDENQDAVARARSDSLTTMADQDPETQDDSEALMSPRTSEVHSEPVTLCMTEAPVECTALCASKMAEVCTATSAHEAPEESNTSNASGAPLKPNEINIPGVERGVAALLCLMFLWCFFKYW